MPLLLKAELSIGGARARLLAATLGSSPAAPRLSPVATGDGGLLCVELTAPSQDTETLASLPPRSQIERKRERQGKRQVERGFAAVSVAPNVSL